MESGSFFSHARQSEENCNDIGNDDIKYDQQDEYNQCTNQIYHAPCVDISTAEIWQVEKNVTRIKYHLDGFWLENRRRLCI